MTPEEVRDLLKLIAVRDRRTIGPEDIAAWLTDIGQLNFNEASQAVAEHFREEPDKWLMSGHVLKRVKANRAKLIDRAGTFAITKAFDAQPPATEADYRRALNRVLERVGDDQCPPFKALTAGTPEPSLPPEEARRHIDALKERRERERLAAARLPERDEPSRVLLHAESILLTLTPEAAHAAWSQAIAELGMDVPRDQLTIRAAQLADLDQTAQPERLTERVNGARSACPYGCQWGTHEDTCPRYDPETS